MTKRHIEHSTSGATLADLLERILDKGIVIAGDIKVKIVDIELLTIQIRLLICSVDKAKEIGVDWWVNHPAFSRHQQEQLSDSLLKIEERLAKVETPVPTPVPTAAKTSQP
jgi:Gas vesicle protein